MRKATIVVAGAVLALTASGLALASEELAKKNGCLGCHDVNAKKVGPSFKSVAAKYKGKPDAEAALVKELGEGKKHPPVKASEEDRAALVKWVLSQ
ncbi:MAG TPA: c-type cytochrome [Usitatibacter sp.]|jgi:cytochrome c|nr:c-type cytochrome [Usitatibacter sp.]